MMEEKKMNEVMDDDLDVVTGGVIKKYANDHYEVFDDKKRAVVATFDNKESAVAYAKQNKIRSNILVVKKKKK